MTMNDKLAAAKAKLDRAFMEYNVVVHDARINLQIAIDEFQTEFPNVDLDVEVPSDELWPDYPEDEDEDDDDD